MQGVFIFRVATYTPIEYLGYKYPYWGEIIGWLMALSSILVIPSYMVYMFVVTPGSLRHVSFASSLQQSAAGEAQYSCSCAYV